MKRQISGIFTLMAMLLVICLAVLISRPWSQREGRTATAPLEFNLIRTSYPRRRDFSALCQWFGTVESKKAVKIVALEAGRIVSVNARDGMAVKPGSLLFVLGGPRVSTRLKAMEKKITALKERLTLAKRAVAMKQEAVNEKIAKREELGPLKDALAQLGSELEGAKQDLKVFQDGIRIRAPMGGLFTKRSVSIGQDVGQGHNLAELIAPQELRVVASLFPPTNTLPEGKRAVIHAPQGGAIAATVVRVLSQRSPEGATVVWMEGEGLEQVLKPGETVSGDIVLSVRKRVLSVPKGAIVQSEHEQTYVFLKRAGGYHRQAVRTGLKSGGWVEITSGITEKSEVVVQGAYELFYRDFNKLYKVGD